MTSQRLLVLAVYLGIAVEVHACPKADASADKTLDAVQKARAAGDTATAKRLVTSVLSSNPQNVRALYAQGLIHIDQKNFAVAEQTIAKAAQLQEGCTSADASPDFGIYNTLGWVQAAQGKGADAEKNYRKAIDGLGATSPRSSQAKSNLGTLLFAQGRFNDAKPYLTEAQATGSKSAAQTLKQLNDAQNQFDTAVAPRVFVQVSDQVPKGVGDSTVQALKDWHFTVPQLQVVKKAPQDNQVRYFHMDDKATAEALATQLTNANFGMFTAKAFDANTTGFIVPEKQLEVWVSHNPSPEGLR